MKDGMQDGFRSISEEVFDLSSPNFGTQKHQGKTKTKFELCDIDLIFKFTEVIQVADI